MCNIAGYVGERDAAPILIEMMLREEGWAGGYYSGLATIHEGKIYYAKITGDMNRLLSLTDAAKLPGKIGIIHSRSNGGGDDEWSHPFIGRGETTAYIANGSAGFFKDPALRAALSYELENGGYPMRSRTASVIGAYPAFEDGSSVHISDAMCQLITRNIDAGMDASDAMNRAYHDMPSEIVGLLLSLTDPDAIVWSRYNMPCRVGFAPHGAYLSSTALAFPDDAEGITQLPAMSGGRVFKNGYTVRRYADPPCTCAEADARTFALAYEICVGLLAVKECRPGDLSKAIAPVFPEGNIAGRMPVVYGVLEALDREGRLQIIPRRVPGAREDLDAPRLFAKLK